jgi:alkylation response protein AidB-like acyl-CoA dehydrogenase
VSATSISVEEFEAEASEWLAANAERRRAGDSDAFVWGQGEFSVAVFHNLAHQAERDLLEALRSWNQKKAEHGYHAIRWPVEFGGRGLGAEHGRAFQRLEANYQVPAGHELFSVTTGLIAPTVKAFGTAEQCERFITPLLRTDIYTCQLFSEPGAGSDLAALACRAERDGDEWVVNGQKVWSSGAQFSEWGLLIARSDVDAAKHKGMTAFMMPLDIPGVEIRPIKQMSGGQSFNEVFFSDARIPDSLRLGAVGDGWKVALTTLGFERDHSSTGASTGGRVGGNWVKLKATADALGRTAEPAVRNALVDYYIHSTVERWLNRRAADNARGGVPGPEGSLGKIMWTEGMTLLSDVISTVLGPRLTADTGEWGTYSWEEHVLGAPGYRIAGGSDEVQRNIVGERVLGLPGEPRVDKDLPWRDIPR